MLKAMAEVGADAFGPWDWRNCWSTSDAVALWVWRWLGAGRDGRSIVGRLGPCFPRTSQPFSGNKSATTRTRHRPRRRQGGKESQLPVQPLPLPPVNMIVFGILSSTFYLENSMLIAKRSRSSDVEACIPEPLMRLRGGCASWADGGLR